jgi:hypothetical protein
MSRWWMSGALIAAMWGVGAPAPAQYMPTQVGAARMCEPIPCGPSTCSPNLVPGPISPQAAPPGPPAG